MIIKQAYDMEGVKVVDRDDLTDKPVYRVCDPNSLTQLIGFFKFRAESGLILLRGQRKIYKNMLPTGLRQDTPDGSPLSAGGRARRLKVIPEYVDLLAGGTCTCNPKPTFGNLHECTEIVNTHSGKEKPALQQLTYRAAVEPMLQHYGLKTRWLDVVDNVWVALWFACHKEISVGAHAYHLRRTEVPDEDASPNAYIVIMDPGKAKQTEIPGYWVTHNRRVIDLRYCLPSVYLRPHAQHGMLIAPRTLPSDSTGSLMESVVAYIEIPLENALSWLGSGAMTSTFVLFPPAARDRGFRRLLEKAPTPPSRLGAFRLYGPGN